MDALNIASALGEKEVLHNIFSLIHAGVDFRMQWNNDLYELLNDMGEVQSNFYAHVFQIEEDDPALLIRW